MSEIKKYYPDALIRDLFPTVIIGITSHALHLSFIQAIPQRQYLHACTIYHFSVNSISTIIWYDYSTKPTFFKLKTSSNKKLSLSHFFKLDPINMVCTYFMQWIAQQFSCSKCNLMPYSLTCSTFKAHKSIESTWTYLFVKNMGQRIQYLSS